MVYTPKIAPIIDGVEDLRKYVEDELREVSLEMQQEEIQNWRVLHVMPAKIAEGMVVFCDGTDLDLGQGGGLYERFNGEWVKLGNVGDEFVIFADQYLVADGITINSASVSITSGTDALTVVGASFTAADVGKRIVVPGAGAAGATLHTTIDGFTSSTQVSLANNASTTLTAVAASVTYGTDDTNNVKVLADVISAVGTGRVEFPVNKKIIIWPDAVVPVDDFLMEIEDARGLVINFNGSHFHSLFTTTGNRGWTIVLEGCHGVTINDYHHISDRGKGTGLDGGVVHLCPRLGTRQVWLNHFTAQGGNAGILAFRNPGAADARSTHFHVDMNLTDVFYGINGFYDLDYVHGFVRTDNAGRSLFPNGNSKGWEITVDSRNPTGFGDCNISVTASETTEDDFSAGHRIHYINNRSTATSLAWIYLGFTQYVDNLATQGGRSHVEITLDCVSAGGSQVAVVAQSFQRTGPGTQALGDAPHVARIRLSGRIVNAVTDVFRIGNSADGWGNSAILNLDVRDLTTSSGNFVIGNGTNTFYTFTNVDSVGVGVLVADAADPKLRSFNSIFSGVSTGILLKSGDTIAWASGDVTITHSANTLNFGGASSGYGFDATINITVGSLLLPSGGAISWSGGDITITHSTNLLAFAGAASGYTFDALLDLSAAAAGQIKFPASQNASANPNTLDDYEEGTWTPTLTAATVGDLSVVYAVRTGNVTKIGRLVFVDWAIETSTFTHSTAAGEMRITGLPYTPPAAVVGGNVVVQNWTNANFTILAPTVGSSPDRIVLTRSGSGQTPGIVAITEFASGNTTIVTGSMMYYAS